MGVQHGEQASLVRRNTDLERATAVHLVEGLLEFVDAVFVGHHSPRLDFAAVEVRDGTREAVCLGERANDLQIEILNTSNVRVTKITVP